MEHQLSGIRMQSPIIIGSGPLSYGAPGLIRLHQAGAGAVVTKTINLLAAKNPVPHIAGCGANTLVNCEKWSDYSPEQWIKSEIPAAKQEGVVVIASVGASAVEQPEIVASLVRAGADMVELVSYTEADLPQMVKVLRSYCSVPMFAKLSSNYGDFLGVAHSCNEYGCDGFTACDSIGPAIKIDIETGRPVLGDADGRGWLSGAAIKPLILHRVLELRQEFECPIIGLGGITAWEDCIEFSMAGANAFGICSAPMLQGVQAIKKLDQGIVSYLQSHNHQDINEICGLTARHLLAKEQPEPYHMGFQSERCTACRRCVTVCPYAARALGGDKEMHVDHAICRSCGLCVSVCPGKCLKV